MNPTELSNWIEQQRKEIDEELTANEITHPWNNNYAYAYGRMKIVLLTAAVEAARLDPAYELMVRG